MVTAGILAARENSHSRAGNRTRDLMISGQRLWPLDQEAGHSFSINASRCASRCIYTNAKSRPRMSKLIVISWTALGSKCADVRATDTPRHEVLNHRPINFPKIYELSSWGPAFLDAFAKLRKASISVMSVTSVCLSSWNNSAPNGRILIFEYFSKNCWEISSFINL